MLIDTHFHLDLMDNMKTLIQEMDGLHVGVIAVGTTPKAFHQELRFCAGVKNIRVGLGLHPQLIEEREKEIDLFLNLVKETRYIGEIGLDFSSSYIDSKEKQIYCFRRMAEKCAKEGGKILSIHSLKSIRIATEELKSAGTFESCACIFHWFTGTATERKRLIEEGAYFSINPKMLKTKSGQDTIRNIPADRVLLETDAPFTMKIDGISSLKKELKGIVDVISSIRDEELSEQIEKNGERIWI